MSTADTEPTAGPEGRRHGPAVAKFVVVGFVNTAVFLGVYLLLRLVMPYLAASVLAQLVALGFAYVSNSMVTFGVRMTLRSALLYPLANLGGLGLRTGLVFVLVEFAHLSDRLAAPVSVALVTPVSYVLAHRVMPHELTTGTGTRDHGVFFRNR